MFRHILAPTDGSAGSLRAIKSAATLARQLGAELTLVHVASAASPPVMSSEFSDLRDDRLSELLKNAFQSRAERYLDSARSAAKTLGVRVRTEVRVDSEPWKGIVEAARELGCDLIVMASHGRKGLAALVLGSETNKVLIHCAIPVLVYREGHEISGDLAHTSSNDRVPEIHA
jgi:nucleotide-binding universal stress UspA family protein